MTPIAAPASSTAQGLREPSLPAMTEGRPKIPLPIIELTTSAARLQRPMARTSPEEPGEESSGEDTASLYHKSGDCFPVLACQTWPFRGQCARIGVELMANQHRVFVTGGTGYLGRPLISALVANGHEVRALVRPGSEHKLPAGCVPVSGDALDGNSYAAQIAPADTFVQLVGVAHPSPAKATQFRSVDFVSACGAIDAARRSGIRHFIYVSVAHPAPMMKAYIEVRSECEDRLRASGMNATILRPWYVLGKGHRWPYALIPLYWLAEKLPTTRDGARRLGLVTHEQMLRTLQVAVETPARGVRIVEVPDIRCGLKVTAASSAA